MNAPLAVAGSLNMDLVARAPRLPRPGETVIGDSFHTLPGGKGANQAIAAARLGGAVAMIGKLGDDPFSDALQANLDAAGVARRYVTRQASAPAGVALITVDAAGQNSIVVAPGANALLTPADVDAAEPAIAGARVLLLQLEIPLESVLRAAQLGRRHGATVILNPAPARPLPAELLALTDILVPNETEAALLTGRPVSDAAAALRSAGAHTVILTLGAQGALLAEAGEMRSFPAFCVRPVDTTAAGDAFLGGLGVALAEGRPLEEAIRWGNAAGALATTRLGAQPSLPRRAELEALLGTAPPAGAPRDHPGECFKY